MHRNPVKQNTKITVLIQNFMQAKLFSAYSTKIIRLNILITILTT